MSAPMLYLNQRAGTEHTLTTEQSMCAHAECDVDTHSWRHKHAAFESLAAVFDYLLCFFPVCECVLIGSSLLLPALYPNVCTLFIYFIFNFFSLLSLHSLHTLDVWGGCDHIPFRPRLFACPAGTHAFRRRTLNKRKKRVSPCIENNKLLHCEQKVFAA